MEFDRRTVISLILVIAVIGITVMLIFKPPEIPDQVMSVLNVLLGVIIAKFATIIDFDFGSSSGSKAKDDALIQASRGGGDVHVEHSTIETTEAKP